MEKTSFNEALKALVNGKTIRRDSWGSDMAGVWINGPAEVAPDCAYLLDDLPQSVRDEMKESKMFLGHSDKTISEWEPSDSDKIAEDWVVLD